MARREYYNNGLSDGSGNQILFWFFMIVVGVILSVAVIKWVAHLAVILGPILIVSSFLIYLVLKDNAEWNGLLIASIFFIVGLLLLTGGIVTLDFFQSDPTGQQLSNLSDNGIQGMSDFYNYTIKLTSS